MTPELQTLKAMRSLLSDPDKWYKGYYAADVHGNDIEAHRSDACKFCLVGAREKVWYDSPELRGSEAHILVQFAILEVYPNHPAKTTVGGVGFCPIPGFNDHPDTTHEMVLAVLDRAIEKETKE